MRDEYVGPFGEFSIGTKDDSPPLMVADMLGTLASIKETSAIRHVYPARPQSVVQELSSSARRD
jgi:hypothetical protein